MRFALVLFGVQHFMRNALLLQQVRQVFRGFDRRRADEYRLLARHAIADVFADRVELVLLGEIDEVGRILAGHRAIGRDDDHLEPVDLQEFRRFGVGRAGHAGQLLVETEVVLEGDRRDRLVLFADAHAFLRFNGLVQTVGPAAALHRATGELVDDDDFTVADDVLDVALEDRMRAQRRVQVMHQSDVRRVVETLALAQQPRFEHRALRRAHAPLR